MSETKTPETCPKCGAELVASWPDYKCGSIMEYDLDLRATGLAQSDKCRIREQAQSIAALEAELAKLRADYKSPASPLVEELREHAKNMDTDNVVRVWILALLYRHGYGEKGSKGTK